MKKYLYIILIMIFAFHTYAYAENLDYYVNNGKFLTSEGVVPNGCFGQLMSELNGDNSIAAIFINNATLRGCIQANYPYPGGNEEDISYKINKKLDDNTFKITVCQVVHGSMGETCDKIIVKFVNRKYILPSYLIETSKKVLSLEKMGEW